MKLPIASYGFWTAPAERSGDGAFASTERPQVEETIHPFESGAKATALQTLARMPSASNCAKRLDCGAFTAAFGRAARPQIDENIWHTRHLALVTRLSRRSLAKADHLSFRRAFTLIEIMIVIGIIGLLAAMGLPSLDKMLRKEGMRKAVSDVQDVFFSAREQAIVYNKKVAVVFYPRENRFGVEGAAASVNVHSGKTLIATLPDGVQFAMLDIFHQDYVQSEWAKVFFNPDGTSDECVIVLISKGRTQKITLEYATGMPEVSATDQ